MSRRYKRYSDTKARDIREIKLIFRSTAGIGQRYIGMSLGEIILSCISSPIISVILFGIPIAVSLIILNSKGLSIKDCNPSLFYKIDKAIDVKVACGVIGVGSMTIAYSLLLLIPALLFSQLGIIIFTSRTIIFLLKALIHTIRKSL